jgi:hypothetical protein
MPARKPPPPLLLALGQRVWVQTVWVVAGRGVRATWDPGTFLRQERGRVWVTLDNGKAVSRPAARVRTTDPTKEKR